MQYGERGALSDRVRRIACAVSIAVIAPMTLADGPTPREFAPVDLDALPITVEEAAGLIGLADGALVQLADDVALDETLVFELELNGAMHTIDLTRWSTRSSAYRVMVDRGGGDLVEVDPGPVRTYRGALRDVPGSDVRGTISDDGVHLLISDANGTRQWLQPLERAGDGVHILYDDQDVLPHDGTCGGPDARVVGDADAIAARDAEGGGGTPTEGAGLFIAQLACDADVQYFQDYGSVSAVENRINLIVNTVNSQYESQVEIRHEITTIIVRTNEPDPYSSSNAETLLCQFIEEWTDNQQSVPRDVAHLLTGREISGGTIGIAADIGGSGICVTQGSCTGGPFGPIGSYCLAQSDFNGNFSCATDLTAHELGHLWGGFHCNCPGFTMFPSIQCANNFTNGTRNSIETYRDTRACLTCPTCPPPNDACATAELVASNASFTVDTSNATPPAGQVDPDLPAGSPSCQWDGTPSDAHGTVWYEFVATDTSVRIETCGTSDVNDTFIALYDGASCFLLDEIACAEDDCDNRSILCASGLEPGETYTFVVGNPGSWAGSQPGVIEIDVISPCPEIGTEVGACCLPNDACLTGLTVGQCNVQGGSFVGFGTSCATIDCANLSGACCFPDGSCFIFDPSVCAIGGGVFGGSGTTCDDIECGDDECIGDFNDDGQVAFDDLVAALSAWGTCTCPQDLDGNGEVDFSDLVTILSAWGPCP